MYKILIHDKDIGINLPIPLKSVVTYVNGIVLNVMVTLVFSLSDLFKGTLSYVHFPILNFLSFIVFNYCSLDSN